MIGKQTLWALFPFGLHSQKNIISHSPVGFDYMEGSHNKYLSIFWYHELYQSYLWFTISILLPNQAKSKSCLNNSNYNYCWDFLWTHCYMFMDKYVFFLCCLWKILNRGRSCLGCIPLSRKTFKSLQILCW